jgi:U3 small nucleolar RNA-associated protein 3
MAEKLSLDYERDYENSESEEEYTAREKSLLKKARKSWKRNDSDSEDEVMKFDESDSSEPEKFEADSDIEGNENDKLPDTREWGGERRAYYGTDFHDKDYSGYTKEEEEIALMEQQEAINIQKRLASELKDADFGLEMFMQSTPDEKQSTDSDYKVKTKTDLSDLSKKEKLALFQADSPEFFDLVREFKERMTESKEILVPALELFKMIELPKHDFIEFLECRNELILNYCTNISFYLLLKSQRVKIRNHPIVQRLGQFQKLICQLDDRFEFVIKPQLEVIMAEINDSSKKSKLKMLESLKNKMDISAHSDVPSDEDVGEEVDKPVFNQNSESEQEEMENNENDDEFGGDGDKKRKITRQIAKNKGLTASKRRELRNPRVKNKKKYLDAVKRRKGAVQPIRPKDKLYQGEPTGIKVNIKRSTKLK